MIRPSPSAGLTTGDATLRADRVTTGSAAVRRALLPLLGVFLLVLAWQAWSAFTPEYVLPSPRRVFGLLRELLVSTDFWRHLGASSYRITLGFLASVVAGVSLGVAMGYVSTVRQFLELIVPLFQSVPSVCWSLLAILWFGLTDATPIFVVFTVGFPIMIVNTWEGVRNVDRDLIVMARSFHFSSLATVRKVIVPGILSYVMAGGRLAFGFGWRISILAEALGATNGIGYKIMNSADRAQTDHVMAWTLSIVAVMLLIEYGLFRPLEFRFSRWRIK